MLCAGLVDRAHVGPVGPDKGVGDGDGDFAAGRAAADGFDGELDGSLCRVVVGVAGAGGEVDEPTAYVDIDVLLEMQLHFGVGGGDGGDGNFVTLKVESQGDAGGCAVTGAADVDGVEYHLLRRASVKVGMPLTDARHKPICTSVSSFRCSLISV